MEPYVRQYTNVSGSVQNNSLSYASVKYQVNNKGPIISVIQWSGGGTHAMLIKGYDTSNNSVIYNDPWDGQGHAASYSYYNSNSQWNWIWSCFWR